MSMLWPQIPREPRPGQRPEATTIIQIIRCLRFILARLQVVTPVRRGGGPPETPRTLLVSQNDATTVVVSYGTINSVPPKIGGVLINTLPVPKLTVGASGYVYLHAVVNVNGVITALTIETAASVPVNTATDGYWVLAYVTVASSVITNVAPSAWNLISMIKCGSTTYIFGGFS